MLKMKSVDRRKAAEQYFTAGYNCTQSILMTFRDLLPEGSDILLRAGSPLGGGMGRLREVCGSVTGMFLILGALVGYDTPETGERKTELYRQVQELADRFEKRYGSIVCRDLLGLNAGHDSPIPEARTEAYYQKRPCKEIIGTAAEILSEYLCENETEQD